MSDLSQYFVITNFSNLFSVLSNKEFTIGIFLVTLCNGQPYYISKATSFPEPAFHWSVG